MRPFEKLRELRVVLSSPVHLPMLRFPLQAATSLASFQLELLHQPLADTLVAVVAGWAGAAWRHLAALQLLSHAPAPAPGQLSLAAANTVLASCPALARLGSLATWGLDRDQLAAFKQEVARRNYDLIVD